MALKAKPTTYMRVRRWVDHDLANRYRPASLFVPLFVALIGTAIALQVGGAASAIGWTIALPGAACLGFALWRALRLMRAAAIKGDRQYDRRTKFTLSPEYHSSESVTAASRRKRARQRQPQPR
jgi:hypothetical protein